MEKTKFDFKKEAKKVTDFLAQFKDVKEPILTSKIGPILKAHIAVVYMIGLIVLAIYALVALFRFPNVSAMLGGFLSVLVAFVVFRMLCEILAGAPEKKSEPKALPAVVSKAKTAPKSTPKKK